VGDWLCDCLSDLVARDQPATDSCAPSGQPLARTSEHMDVRGKLTMDVPAKPVRSATGAGPAAIPLESDAG
jgi:hypothetical protein